MIKKKLSLKIFNFDLGAFISNPLFAGSMVMVGGSMASNVVNYFYHFIMGRVLGPVHYGTLASIFSILYIIAIVPLSTSVAIVKFISSAKTREEAAGFYSAVKKFIFKLAVISSLLLLLSTPIIKDFLHVNETIAIILVSPILFFFLALLVNQASLQGILNFWGVTIPAFVQNVIKLVLGYLLILAGFSINGAIGALLVGSVIAYFLSEKLLKKSSILKVKKIADTDLRPFFKYSIPVFLQSLAFTSFFTTDVILAKHFLPPFEAGIYAALSTLGKIIYFAAQPITMVMFPIVSKRHAVGEKYLKILLMSSGLTAVISFGIVVGYYLFSDLAITILYGTGYLSGKPFLVLMGLFMSVYTLTYLFTNFFLSIGRTKVVILPLISAVLQIVLIIYFHSSIREVLLASLFSVLALFAALLGYFAYNWFLNAKHAKN